MKTAIFVLGLLFGVLAIWALIETFGFFKKSPPAPRPRGSPPAAANPHALAATDPYGAANMRHGERDTLPPGRRPR